LAPLEPVFLYTAKIHRALLKVLAGIGDVKNVAVLVLGGARFTPGIPAVYVIVPEFRVGVALYPRPDLSFHNDTFVPEEKVKLVESAESSQSWHPATVVGVNVAALYKSDTAVLITLVPSVVATVVGAVKAEETICVGKFVMRAHLL
jgi:hypothetical protein